MRYACHDLGDEKRDEILQSGTSVLRSAHGPESGELIVACFVDHFVI